MKVQPHSRLKLINAQPLWRGTTRSHCLDHMIRSRFDEASVSQLNSVDRFASIRLHGQDTSRSVRVIDLATNLLLLNQLSNRHHALGRRNHRVVRLTRRALWALLEPDVEPDRRVEGGELVDEDVRQLGLERLSVGTGGKVLALPAPGGDRAGDAADHLLYGALTLWRAELPAEVLLRDDVGRVLRPALRELHVALLEGRLGGVADHRIPRLPVELVERMHALAGESSL